MDTTCYTIEQAQAALDAANYDKRQWLIAEMKEYTRCNVAFIGGNLMSYTITGGWVAFSDGAIIEWVNHMLGET